MPYSRRKFIKTTAIGLSALPFAGSFASAFPMEKDNDLHLLSDELVGLWGKTLLGMIVTDTSDTDSYGGIFCPADKTVHGRVGDTIYPFFYLAEKTNDSRYIDAAMQLYSWSDHRVSQSDGSWLNDPFKGAWKGITVFSSIALAETIKKHGNLMDNKFKNEVTARLKQAGDFVYTNFSINYGNVNYPIAASYGLSLLGEVLDVPKFTAKGKELAHAALPFITKSGFLTGEGGPYDKPSSKGCFSVDLGYNVEESLPSLALYSLLTNDQEVLEATVHALQTQMEFMLPDGAWDNSWGTRNYKWTYWGSRTSDGCQPAYALLAGHDPRFYKVALRNTQLLKQCTKNGLLYGGPHYVSHNVPVCVHHTFCHIKALTTILDHQPVHPKTSIDKIRLPRESAYGIRPFNDIQTWLIAKGKFKATVTGYDRDYHNKNGHATGGALTMLWHEKTGPILTASMNQYQLIEDHNMQPDTDPLTMPLTPRIELKQGKDVYMNISDQSAKIEMENDGNVITLKTRSKLVNGEQQSPPDGEINCRIDYLFSDNSVTIRFGFDQSEHSKAAKIIIPVISQTGEEVKIEGKDISIKKKSSTLKIASSHPLEQLPTTSGRLFNFVPGLEAVPFTTGENEIAVTFSVV